MPITNYVPSSVLSKPGVCTSTTRPSTPYQGMVIYETDTARTLVWNGSAWVFLSTSSAGDVGLVKVIPTSVSGTGVSLGSDGTITFSSTSSMTVNGAFSSTYDNYRMIISNCVGSTSLSLRFSLNGLTSGVYNWAAPYGTTSATVVGDGTSGATYWVICSVDVGDANSSTIDIYGPFLAKRTGMSGTGNGANVVSLYGGQAVDTNSRTGFTIITNTGTVSGTLRLYGYRN